MRAKGVDPETSHRATLHGWRLRFNVRHFFRHEGGVGNIEPSNDPNDSVQGVLHRCKDRELAALDAVEAYGFGYDRIEVPVETKEGMTNAIAYVGVPSFLDDSCLPTQRYMNIIVKGARNAGLDETYVEALLKHPLHEKKRYAPFKAPDKTAPTWCADQLASTPHLTALAGFVFDMTNVRWQHEYLRGLFGGRDMTLFHLKRLDSSDGTETLDDIRHDRLDARQRAYLNEYLHEYNAEYEFAGFFDYE
jgi:sulfite reductase (NADPH) flavoprotein alpha-component